MNNLFIRVEATNDFNDFRNDFIPALQTALREEGRVFTEHFEPKRDGSAVGIIHDTLLILGSAGSLAAFAQIVKAYLGRNKDRRLKLESGGKVFVLEGHTLPEEKELIGFLAGIQPLKSEESRKEGEFRGS